MPVQPSRLMPRGVPVKTEGAAGGGHPSYGGYIAIGLTIGLLMLLEIILVYTHLPAGVLIPLLLTLAALSVFLSATYYMHLKFDSRMFTAMFFGGLIAAGCVVAVVMALFGVGVFSK